MKSVDPQIKIIETENRSDLLNLIKAEQEVSPSLIVLDMNMPLLNGLETLAEIKATSYKDPIAHLIGSFIVTQNLTEFILITKTCYGFPFVQ